MLIGCNIGWERLGFTVEILFVIVINIINYYLVLLRLLFFFHCFD